MILAVEINDSSINIVQASIKKGTLSKFRCVSEDIPQVVDDGNILDAGYLSDRIRKILQRNRINTKKTVFVINSKSIIVRRLRLPVLKKRNEIRTMIEHELSHLMSFDPADYRIHYEVTLDSSNEKYAWYIIYCTPEELLKSYRDLALKSKLRPLGFELYCSCVNKLKDMGEDTLAFTDIGEKRISFTVMNKGIADFSRIAEISYVGAESPLNACMDEIIRCIRYYQSIDNESKISRMYIFNSEIRECFPTFIEKMSAELPDLEIVTEPPIFSRELSCYAGRCFMPVLSAFNEGKGSYKLHKTKYYEISDFRTAAAIAVILVSSLFFIISGIFVFKLYREYEYMKEYITNEENILLNNKMERLKAESQSKEKAITDIESLQNKIKEESYADSEIFRGIFSILPENTYLHSIHVGIAGVSAYCTSCSIEEAAIFISNLRELDVIEDVFADEVSRKDDSESGYEYTIHCVLKGVQQ